MSSQNSLSQLQYNSQSNGSVLADKFSPQMHSLAIPTASTTILSNTSPPKHDLRKYVEQVERKREYNRRYYRTRVKPRKEKQKQELERLRQQCLQYELYIEQMQHGPSSQELDELKDELDKILSELKKRDQFIVKLEAMIEQLRGENIALGKSLDMARQRNYELMMKKSDQFLPKLSSLP